MIRNPNEIQEGAKKIRMLIAGYPGIGKSTLALSAPRPLHNMWRINKSDPTRPKKN